MTLAGALLFVIAVGPGHLTPQDRAWLASVDHVITKQERKQYEALSGAERHNVPRFLLALDAIRIPKRLRTKRSRSM